MQSSVNGSFVEQIEENGRKLYVSLFHYAKGMLLAENGYRYRENAPLSEYFYNTGKALGKIHELSKAYAPVYRRKGYFEKYNMDYIDKLIYDSYPELKSAISDRLDVFHKLPQDSEVYGLVHFDFSDGNYHVDMETGAITVFDFDTILKGYRSETDISEELLSRLPLFIDMVLIENIVDEFECCKRDNEEIEYEDIEDAAGCLINAVPYAGFFTE